MYFSKKVYAVYNGLWAKLQKLGNFRDFCVRSNLTASKVTFYYKIQKKWGSRTYYLLRSSPDNFVASHAYVCSVQPCDTRYQ